MSTNFIDCSENEQAREIRQFLNSIGAEIEVKDDPAEISDIIKNVHVAWTTLESNSEIESVVNSVISLILLLPEQVLKPKIDEFCSQVVADATKANKLVLCLKILTGFFHALSESSTLRYPVYMSMLECAKVTSQLQMVETDLGKLKAWRSHWTINIDQWQALLRLLHTTLVKCGHTQQAGQTMYLLLASYDDYKQQAAVNDAITCVKAELNNRDVYLLDHLISLKPVSNLKGNRVYELLEIFVSKGLEDYQKFESKHMDFLKSENFDTAELTRKIRLLTFASLAVECKEISFVTLGEKLQLSNDEIEQFIIEAIRSKVIKAKIDQLNDKLIVTSVAQRTFSGNEWKALLDTLNQWRSNVQSVKAQIATVSMDLSNPL